jgi:hypothetical protein
VFLIHFPNNNKFIIILRHLLLIVLFKVLMELFLHMDKQHLEKHIQCKVKSPILLLQIQVLSQEWFNMFLDQLILVLKMFSLELKFH